MPRKGYIPRGASRWNNPWTDEQKALLERLAAAKRPWAEIAERCGHPQLSCRSVLSYIRRGRKRPPSRGDGRIMRQRQTPPAPSLVPNPATPPSVRRQSMYALQADAEWRDRIETLGPTGGLLGDPLPGRSALDQKRSGAPT